MAQKRLATSFAKEMFRDASEKLQRAATLKNARRHKLLKSPDPGAWCPTARMWRYCIGESIIGAVKRRAWTSAT